MLLDTVCASLCVCVCVCVFCMLGFMQCSEAHSNTSKSTTWDHQIKKIYSVVLAYAVNSGDWSRNNKPRGLIAEQWILWKRLYIASSY